MAGGGSRAAKFRVVIVRIRWVMTRGEAVVRVES